MRRTLAVVSVSLVGATAAWAGWTAPSGVQGTPTDVVVEDAGQVVLATNTAAQEFVDGVLQRSISGAFVSAFIDPNGCLAGVNTSGMIEGDGTSGCGFLVDTTLGNGVRRVREGSAGQASGCSFSTVNRFAWSNVGTQSGWVGIAPGDGTCSPRLSVLSSGGSSYALYGLNPGFRNTHLFVDSVSMPTAPALVTPGLPRSVQLTPMPDGGVGAYVVDSAGVLETSQVAGDAGLQPWTALPLPDGVTGLRAADLHLAGDERFGMAVGVVADGGYRILSAVPHPDPAMAGRQWRESTFPFSPAQLAALDPSAEIDCLEAVGCAIASAPGGTGALLVYVNAAPPNAASAAQAQVSAGSSVTVPVTVSDPDGDAVWVDWVQQAPTSPTLSAAVHDGGLSATIAAPADLLCDGGVPVSFVLRATDGRHENSQGTAQVTMIRTDPPQPLLVSPSQLIVPAGAAPQALSISAAPGECANWPVAITPTIDQGVAILALPDGGTAVQPPLNVCAPEGITATFFARSTGPWGVSDGGRIDVQVTPWGPPLSPFASGTVPQDAGTTVVYARESTHVCHDLGVDVPVETTFWMDADPPEGVVLSPALPAGAKVATEGVSVQNGLACDGGTITLHAQSTTEGQSSSTATLTILLEPSRAPDSAAVLELSLAPEGLRGEAMVSGVDCLHQRDYTAEVTLELDGGIVESGTHAVPGPWSLPTPRPCAPTTYTVNARLNAPASGTAPPLTWTSEGVPPVLGEIPDVTFTASCGAPAEARLEQHPAAQACDEQTVQWERVSGPALESDVLEGAIVTARTVQTGWDGLLGEAVTFRATAMTGASRSNSAEVVAPIRPHAPFVEAAYATDAPVVTDSDVLTLSVVLENTSGCAVSGTTWTESLEGLRYVEGSARVDGAPIEARLEDARLLIEGISLEAGARRTISYSARPALLGQPSPSGVLTVKGVEVSSPAGILRRTPEGCGCAGGGGGAPGLLVLGLLIRILRRRGGEA